ncbi:hypothetical protein PBCV1_A664L [Paramecium bursaria Chlorella virus 1]|uniref:Uncharacterized protein n=1 Tax=Paramecium bursaria Chlorella virus 1 TaxID=10506 RepID=O41146_PBCV1|nr:hypothetical protein PBCV1_A664L [Paramecium bursaria Chlorella virus 1]AGE51682.1 hypothetical protein PBCVCviKI_707L [Paramecium bursaria Chlorella virus CviKI]AGE52698.1 hypothetical protein PBCVCvsA1_727L [Paramecium bursaria Chlorella virus CvsA1]AGE55487.1 hypothetical protein PBCVMA1E_816L [Paramecium bursaria Chlorella virus MA1E]AGE57487.1 hypothetical protein PBCVNEJV4_749L [Paramecium bursaria Chlorella virus NE-JV-4]AAC96979.2 hypothetical protein [Paramecium bursaria Chlorella 
MFVVTQVGDNKNMAGIPHSHAVRNINGSAVFGFRQLPTAAKVAIALDHHIRHTPGIVFTEDLMEPISNLSKGQNVRLSMPTSYISKNRPLELVSIARVQEEELINYAAAMQISVIVLGEKEQEIYVEDILSPARSIEFSAGYLDYIYNEKEYSP